MLIKIPPFRCFKRKAGIDQEDETTVTPLPDTVTAEDTKSHPGVIKSNSSNVRHSFNFFKIFILLPFQPFQTGNSTTTTASSVINHHNQVEIGAPSMDWFTKERRKCDPLTNNNNSNSIPTPGSDSLDVHPEDLEEDDIKPEDDQFFQDSTTGRRLRKRSQKRNYKDLQRTSISNSSTAILASNNINSTSTSSTSWSCASSSSSSSSSAVVPVNNSNNNNSSSSAPWSVVSPFGTSSNVFTLDELRWAFLPKFKRRGGVKKEKGSTTCERERKSNNSLSNTVKVPYEKSREGSSSSSSSSSRANSRRASRDVQNEMREEVKLLLNGKGESQGGIVMEAKSRLARGDKYSVRGKRQDSLGNVQYLIEWENKGT